MTFEDFHAANPEVYAEIVRIARKALENGKSRVSMKMIFELIRFTRTLEIKGDGQFMLNNNFTSHYARLVQGQEPDLAHLFEIRSSRTRAAAETTVSDEEIYRMMLEEMT